jgi:hypothetical protein
MIRERRLRIAWKAYLVDKGVMQMLERPSEAEIAERARKYFRWRLEEALEVLPTDSAKLAEVLNELFALLVGEDEIVDWQPPTLAEAGARIGGPLRMETNAAER